MWYNAQTLKLRDGQITRNKNVGSCNNRNEHCKFSFDQRRQMI